MIYRINEVKTFIYQLYFCEENSLNYRLYSAKSNQNVFNATRKCDISCKRNDSPVLI